MHRNTSNSIGIIGGADGPTSIFISGSLGLAIIQIILVLLIIGVIFFVMKKSRKQ
ncbi:MAG: hypothetical protein WC996_08640 [Peptostreptococcales bacterium]